MRRKPESGSNAVTLQCWQYGALVMLYTQCLLIYNNQTTNKMEMETHLTYYSVCCGMEAGPRLLGGVISGCHSEQQGF